MEILRIEHLSKVYGQGENQVRAVDDVSFSVEKGEFLAIIGPSGSGKSTLLHILGGVDRPTSGKVYVDGQDVYAQDEDHLAIFRRRQVGLIYQFYNLIPVLNVVENMTLPVLMDGRAVNRQRLDELLDVLGLRGREKHLPNQLSGGQQQRVALARILASEPRAVLLDEPFSALDSFLKWNLEMELTEVLDSFAGPAIWVSHDRGEAFRNCRWVCVMDQGKTLPAQAMDELFFSPGTEAAARLTGCKNYARAITNGNTVTLPEWGIALRCAEKAGSMVQCVGIRAHSVRPATLGEENAFSCTVERIIQDVFSTIILLRPVGATQEAPLLWMEMDKNNGQKIHNSRTLTVAVAPQQIMLLH